ncbi:MAG: ribonucleoside triphosphate reductase, partial [Eubacterium sp.]|nr:ribonucleoside triphosphate reductase [Eubacterium sp.]
IPSRWGTQAPFSNITLDWTCPDDLKNLPAVVGGEEQDFTYGECEKEMAMVNKAFIEVMVEGDYNGRGFAYPIPTYSITRDFDWSDTENNRLLFEMAAKYGTPYFSNYINSDMEPSDVRSMCCRLRLDLRELRKQNGGNFGAGENTGSIGVVTINMPRIAYLSKNEVDFFRRLEHMMDISARSLDIKRKVINKYIDMGLYPYPKRYLPQGFVNHFSTIGLVGMNEACLNAKWLNKELTHPEAAAWTAKVLDFMREKLSDYQEEYGDLFNLEATPAESTAYRLAKHDRELYPDIITAGAPGEIPYYTNSSHLPVGSTDDVFDALDIQDNLQTKYTSGTVFHCFLGEKLPDWKAAMQLIRTVAENYTLPYFTLSPVYSVCEEHGYLTGEQKICPVCGKATEVYSRITGYYRPVHNWNDGKMQEFLDRKSYDIKASYASVKHSFSDEMYSVDTDAMIDRLSTGSSLEEAKEESRPENQVLFFTTPTCPMCHMLKEKHMLDGCENLVEIDASKPENGELVQEFQIMSAPTLIVIEDGSVQKYDNASGIIGYVSQRG